MLNVNYLTFFNIYEVSDIRGLKIVAISLCGRESYAPDVKKTCFQSKKSRFEPDLATKKET
jgi:hypothetical protein